MIAGRTAWIGSYPMARSRIAPECNCKYIVHDHSDTPHVASDTVLWLIVQDQLRSHIQDGPYSRPILLRVLFPQLLGKAKVGQFGSATLDEYVLRLDVAVGNVVVVEQTGCIGDVPEDRQCLHFGQCATGLDVLFEVAEWEGEYTSHSSMKM